MAELKCKIGIAGQRGPIGPVGPTGAEIVSTELIGQDPQGGNIYKQTFDNGVTANFTAPKGEPGQDGEDGEDGAPGEQGPVGPEGPAGRVQDVTVNGNSLLVGVNAVLDPLQTEINNLKNIGRFLAIWDASTGTPTSEPITSPYTYKVGDYYRIGVEGNRNPKGDLTYVIGGTNYVVGSTLSLGDVVYCSNVTTEGTTWVRQASSGGGTVQDVQINGTSILSSGIANIPNSSGSASGVMTSAQYTKLSGIEAGADVTDATNVEAAGAIMKIAQTLTDSEKLQARTNINAANYTTSSTTPTTLDNGTICFVI